MVTEKTKAMRTPPKGIHSFGNDDDVVNEAADLGWVVSSDGDEATTPEAAEARRRWRTRGRDSAARPRGPGEGCPGQAAGSPGAAATPRRAGAGSPVPPSAASCSGNPVISESRRPALPESRRVGGCALRPPPRSPRVCVAPQSRHNAHRLRGCVCVTSRSGRGGLIF